MNTLFRKINLLGIKNFVKYQSKFMSIFNVIKVITSLKL